MPSFVVKAAKDQNLYAYWSTVVEAPTFIGTRDEILEHLAGVMWLLRPGFGSGVTAEERVERADEAGTSALYFTPPTPQDGAWEDKGFIYMQQGWLPREKLPELLERLLVDEDADVKDLLDAFEEDHDAEPT